MHGSLALRSAAAFALLALLATCLCANGKPISQAGTPIASQPIAVTSISPSVAAAVPAGGIAFPTEVVITGQNFRNGASVKIGTQDAGIVSVAPTQIHATVPGEAAGVMDLTVTNPEGNSATLPKAFTYTTGPVVYSVAPQTGSSSAPSVVTMTGGNLSGDSKVTVGGLPATVQFFLSSTALEVQVPANPSVAAGGKISGAVVVTNADGQSFSLQNGFTWTGAPQPAPNVHPTATPDPSAPSPTSTNKNEADSCG